MIEGRRVVGFIPARGGSLGVPKKNIRPLAGAPLLAHTIRPARTSRYLDALVLSTDDDEIKAAAFVEGVDVIDRPAEISGPEASTESALLHALDQLEAAGSSFDLAVVLEPTSPFRSVATIDGAIETIVARDGASLLGVRESHEVVGTLADGVFRPLIPGEPRRRQDRAPKYIEASTIYVCRVDFLRRTGKLACADWLAYVVPPTEAVDINTLDDFAYAEFLMNGRPDHE